MFRNYNLHCFLLIDASSSMRISSYRYLSMERCGGVQTSLEVEARAPSDFSPIWRSRGLF